jgi:hypothetical protein
MRALGSAVRAATLPLLLAPLVAAPAVAGGHVTSRDDDSVPRCNGASGAFLAAFVPPGSGGLDGPVDLVFLPTGAPVPVPSLAPGAAAALAFCIGSAGAACLRRRARRGA